MKAGPQRTVTTVHTPTPARVTLAKMGETARAAADTWTLRQWAARLATRAGPKDYRGQLEQLYRGIIDRWRYVMEDGEWIHGTPRSLLGTVLGLSYNGVRDPTRADVERTPIRERGWGDCDDVATLCGAGVIALGMRPVWRVSRAGSGQAHVSTAAITPDGDLVQLDPVGHPRHPFGWAQSGPDIDVTYHSLDGLPLAAPTLGATFGEISMAHPQRAFAVAAPIQPTPPQFYPGSMIQSPMVWQAVPYGFGDVVANEGTYLGVLTRAPRGGLTPYQGRVRRHLVCVAPNDQRGARVLAVPGYHARAMMAGASGDGCPAVDQYGAEYTYSRAADLWVPRSSTAGRVAAYGFGASRADRKAKRKAKRRRTMKRVGRFFVKVGKGIRKIGAAIMGSKFVQTIVAGVLQVFGIPMKLTKTLLTVAAKFVGKGGLIKLLKGVRKNPKKVLKTLAKTVAAAGRSDLLKGVKGFSGPGNGYEPLQYEINQRGVTAYAAPVEGIVGLDGVFGDTGEGTAFAEKPTPGYFYRVQKGDALPSIADRAYGKALPGGRWIAESAANAYASRPSKDGYEKKYYGARYISLLPKYSGEMPGGPGNKLPALWIPPAAGVEPSVAPVFPDSPTPEIDDDPAFDDEPDDASPGPIPVPPADDADDGGGGDVVDEDTGGGDGDQPADQPPSPTPVVPVEPTDTLPVEDESTPSGPPPAPAGDGGSAALPLLALASLFLFS